MQFSLRWLFGAVSFAAIGCVSLVYVSPWVSHALNSAVFAFLMVSVLQAIYAHQRREFWMGCAIVGWGYVLGHVLIASLPPRVTAPVSPARAASDILRWLDPILHGQSIPPSAEYHAYYQAGYALATFVWSIAGGIVAGRIRRGD